MKQDTSIKAYKNLNLGKRQLQVLEAVRELKYCTNNMIAEYLKLPINSITGRVKELRDKKLIFFSHTSWCPIRKTKCHYWKYE